ncbi:MAG: hypothetical protein CMO80_22130 [Verrucomicrobiales bacterium]|nr:hypothetical protein [Verrucomicrobiales bacterium]|tara:strand:+ start:22765 stop:23022 length:258 start_codon:yes stop_codon:yes gene_type:complete
MLILPKSLLAVVGANDIAFPFNNTAEMLEAAIEKQDVVTVTDWVHLHGYVVATGWEGTQPHEMEALAKKVCELGDSDYEGSIYIV